MKTQKITPPSCYEIDKNIIEFQKNIVSEIVKKTDDALWYFFYPYLRLTGINGEITKGKVKWRGIKLVVKSDLHIWTYRLVQRGVFISPEFKIDFKI